MEYTTAICNICFRIMYVKEDDLVVYTNHNCKDGKIHVEKEDK